MSVGLVVMLGLGELIAKRVGLYAAIRSDRIVVALTVMVWRMRRQRTWLWLVGIGMGLQFAITGLLAALADLGGYTFTVVRNAEDILPNHDMVAAEV